LIRVAVLEDLPALERLLADDVLGAGREMPGDPAYAAAFAAMSAQAGNTMLVAEADGWVVGCLQLTLIPGLSRRGMLRAQIESVRVTSDARGQRIGEALVDEAISRAKAAGAGLVQLTTDLTREDAHRFYERLGFVGSHLGMKLGL
jgi:ribosomal protein S18 acetylase RimI-like enzyme